MPNSDYQSRRQAQIEEIRTGALDRFWAAMVCRWLGYRHASRYEVQMAWERLTNSGDYAPGGHFDKIYPGWRDFDSDGGWHGPIRSPKAVPVAQGKTPDDRHPRQPERTTDADSDGAGDGMPRAMEIPLFLADPEPLVERRAE